MSPLNYVQMQTLCIHFLNSDTQIAFIKSFAVVVNLFSC